MPTVTSVKIGRTPTYLFRKGSIYYFRIAIPIDVRQVFGRTEINYSLQTDDLTRPVLKQAFSRHRSEILFQKLAEVILLWLILT